MIKPVTMSTWHYEEGEGTMKEVKGYLPGEFDERGFLIGVLPNPFAQPALTPEAAMEMLNRQQNAPDAPVFHIVP